MANTAKKLSKRPVLTPILKTVKKPVLHTGNDDLFDLFGWGDLPFALKNEIVTDLAGYRDELLGMYSTRDEGVFNRRKTVAYWVNCYLSGICSLDTAVDMLKVEQVG